MSPGRAIPVVRSAVLLRRSHKSSTRASLSSLGYASVMELLLRSPPNMVYGEAEELPMSMALTIMLMSRSLADDNTVCPRQKIERHCFYETGDE
jgi:hypothetical protein